MLDDLLDDWRAAVPAPYDGIRVAGTQWSASSHDVKDFLARSQVPYQWLDIEKDAEARTLVESTAEGPPRLPTVFFPDGTALVDPDIGELAEKVGMSTRATNPFYDLVIIGAGPAGLAAAVYGASEGLRTVVIEAGAAGGQAGTSARIENYLGFPQGISGADLTRRATTQAQRLGAEILTAREVTGLRVEDPYRIVTLDDGTELSSHAVLVSTGVQAAQARRARDRTAGRCLGVLRGGDVRSGELPRQEGLRDRRRQLGGAGRDVPRALRRRGHGGDPGGLD